MAKLIKLWVLGSAACVSAGWVLSAAHELNWKGYAVFFSVLFIALAAEYQLRRRLRAVNHPAELVRPLPWRPRRFRRALPLLFLLMAALAALGGALHAPNNYDGLTYRFPRMLHWWAACGWHWIPTPNARINLSGTNFEWLMMPIFIVTHSDRFFFLINIAAYLLLPSLVFLVFSAAGLSRRVAWFWMWLLPAALCYAMQAGSFSNDTIAATYFLAAIYFACMAQQTSSIRNLWLAFFAAALLTGVKATNLPLLLPLAWVFWPALKLVRTRLISSAAVVILAIFVSYLPTAALNRHYTGSWTGDPDNLERVQIAKPWVGILGNGLQLGLQSLEPPFLPVARSVENWIWQRFPNCIQAVLEDGFPRFVIGFRELPQEESAGVGIGIAVIALVSIVAARRHRFRDPGHSHCPTASRAWVAGILTWCALVFYMTKLGSESTSRLIAAYYPLLLLPLLMNPAQVRLVRMGWYKALAIFAGAIALMGVILTPSRPLWPAGPFFDWVVQCFPKNEILARARTVYAVYRCRSDVFAPFRQNIPKSVQIIGLIDATDDAETSLWRPFGNRRVVDIRPAHENQAPDVQWLVVKESALREGTNADFTQWLARQGGAVVVRESITEKVGRGPEYWSVVHLTHAAN